MRRPPPPSRRRRRPAKPREDRPFLLEQLEATLARVPEPAMLRPDLGTLRGQALLAAVKKLEAEGELVVSGGALVSRRHDTAVGRVVFDGGIPWRDVAEPLVAAGLPRRREGSLCE